MPLSINTKIKINASSEKVWQVRTDFSQYPDWNPFVRTIVGDFAVGKVLQVQMTPSQGKVMLFHPIITHIEPSRRLVWLGRVLFTGLFDGEHRFEIESSVEGSVIFYQREFFSGLLSSLIVKLVGPATEAGFNAMNLALKQRVEEGTK